MHKGIRTLEPSLLSKILPGFVTDHELVKPPLQIRGEGSLPSWFQVSDLAVASIGMAGLMLARYAGVRSGTTPEVNVDRRLASFWFGFTLRPLGWEIPSPWDSIAGDYRARNGWIRLHTNAPAHRAAALRVLDCAANRSTVARVVAEWEAGSLETAIVRQGGCAATMRSLADWAAHEQGAAVARDPLVIWRDHGIATAPQKGAEAGKPLAGLKVLDLTRVLAGPVAGRILAAYGANVLRIDPPDWDEPGVVPEVTLGKRCAGLNLKQPEDQARFLSLAADADVLLHGYRPGALVGLGLDAQSLRRTNPGLIDVCLNAYGWSGPWSGRRGFDSLVQMSSGIADYGMRRSGAGKPLPLPVQALDHATGYLMAAAVLRALCDRRETGAIKSARLSLSRVAHLLSETAQTEIEGGLTPENQDDLAPGIETTGWGPARRIAFPLDVGNIQPEWALGAGPLRSSPPRW